MPNGITQSNPAVKMANKRRFSDKEIESRNEDSDNIASEAYELMRLLKALQATGMTTTLGAGSSVFEVDSASHSESLNSSTFTSLLSSSEDSAVEKDAT
ncbi:hypothetical protein C0J52_22039 [Blattella germanica]|nr:hypothetical protein C0J52_22039 [Blattella germanica]